ncbi:MAG TPA: hypothetical protein VH478_18760 [Trebonia sp.]|jgi:hypothetical protein|nr:hypothetical protein [Trebonia sp.]
MGQADPDINELFAPLVPTQAFGVVLSEAQEVLPHVREPVDAELWGSDMIGALSRSTPGEAAAAELAGVLVPAAEEAGTPQALALLRIFAAIGSPGLRAAADQAADRVAANGVAEQPWVAGLGLPAVGDCWHYGDVGGRQESVTVSFAYGDKAHALSVLIDHGRRGKIKDVWVGDATGLLDKTYLAAEADPLVVFERLGPAEAHRRLEQAISAGESPDKPDQREAVAAHRALLYARMNLLAVESAISPGKTGSPGDAGEPGE